MENMEHMDGVYLDLAGRPIQRTPLTHPYSYEAFVLYKSKDYKETDSQVYSDRLLEWDSLAFKAAVREVWPEKPESQMFNGKKAIDIQHFLSLYFRKNVKLTAIMQGCNVGNGYPYWLFAYRDIKVEEENK